MSLYLVRAPLKKVLLVGIAVLLSPVLAQAQTGATISVQPEVFSKSISRGGTWESEVTIVNGSPDPLPIHLSLVRWDASDETGGVTFIEQSDPGSDPVGAPGSNPNEAGSDSDITYNAAKWFSLSEADMILGPNEARIIPFTVRVPDDAEPGGKYVSLWVDPRIPDIYFGDRPVRIIPRITALFLLDIPVIGLDEGDLAPAGDVEEFSVKDRAPVLSGVASRIASLFRAPSTVFASEPGVSVDVLDGKPKSLLLRVRNDGITHIRPSAKLVVRNGFGFEVLESDIEATTILPGRIRELPIEFDAANIPLIPRALERQLALGRYSAQAVISVPGSDPLLTSLTYWVFPWQSLLLGLLAFGGGGVIALRFRHRFAVAFRILLRGPKRRDS